MTVHRKKPSSMPVQLENIPESLKLIPQWVVWSWTPNEAGTKFDKPPRTLTGALGSSTNPEKWCSFKDAAAALDRFDGIGIAIDGTGIIGIDFDDCYDAEIDVIKPEVKAILDKLDTYTEISPSRTGIKAFLSGDYDQSQYRSKVKHETVGDIEVYRSGRYLTVTGASIGNKKIADAGPAFTEFMNDHLAKEDKTASKKNGSPVEPSDDDTSKIKHAIFSCLKVAIPDDEGDGSRRVVKYARQCIRAGLGPEGAITVIRALEAIHPLPVEWSDSDVRKRYASALNQSNVGEAIQVYEQSDYGVAMRVRDFCDGSILYVPDWKKWVAWNGQMFEVDRHGKLIDAIVNVSRQMLQETPSHTGEQKEDEKRNKAWQSFCMNYQSGRGIETIERISRNYMAADYRDLDKRNYLFYAENGTVNIQATGAIKLEPHCRSNMNTMISQVPYIVGSTCPRWIQFIDEVTGGDAALSLYLQKLVGYCLTGIAAEEFFILHGGGNNGKGVFTRTVLKLLGEFGGIVSQDLITTTSGNQHPTQFAYLYNKRCVVATESDEGKKLNESQVKMLTGGDPIQCRRMREDFWEFPPTHKLLLTTNSVPTIRGTDHGIWRRIKLIPFGVRFEKPDTGLEHKLDAELPGILQWAIEGYRCLRFEGWTEPACVTAAKESYRADMDTVAQFIEDMCVLGDHEIEFSMLYQSCKLYCEINGHTVVSSKKLAGELEKLRVTKSGNGHCRKRKGITLKSQFEDAK